MRIKNWIAVAVATAALGAAGVGMAQPPRIVPPAGTPTATTHLNPNTATEAQLRAAGVSADLATAIVRGKPYATQAAVHKVVSARVPAAQQPAIYAAVFVPVGLNTGAREEIATIPGMTPRMIREFEEYRPYKDMTQFNREIGKYVDATELARLASYVAVK
jgi:hypothetical protein